MMDFRKTKQMKKDDDAKMMMQRKCPETITINDKVSFDEASIGNLKNFKAVKNYDPQRINFGQFGPKNGKHGASQISRG